LENCAEGTPLEENWKPGIFHCLMKESCHKQIINDKLEIKNFNKIKLQKLHCEFLFADFELVVQPEKWNVDYANFNT